MKKIIIECDTEKKTISKVEGAEDINPVDLAKILGSVALNALNKVELKPQGKIEVVKPKIIGGK